MSYFKNVSSDSFRPEIMKAGEVESSKEKSFREIHLPLDNTPLFLLLIRNYTVYLTDGGVRGEHPCLFNDGGAYEETEV